MKDSKITRAKKIIRNILDLLFIIMGIFIDVEHFYHKQILGGVITSVLTIAYIAIVVVQMIFRIKQKKLTEEMNNESDNG